MRLLNLDLKFSDHDDNPPPYAILSHTWSENNEEEVTYKGLNDGTAKSLLKLELCRDWAKAAGYEYFWVDTCCINKTDDAEITYAIRSMWRWYCDASVCFVYLSDLSMKRKQNAPDWRDALKDCRWFKRGWTLQELIASKRVEFYAKDGYLGSREDLLPALRAITGIELGASLPSHSTRLTWVNKRQTKRPEDKAYCMLGICEVSLDARYGEGGTSAWRRLQDAIIHRHGTIALEFRSGGNDEDHRQAVMMALRFDAIETRRNTVRVALATTCKWILNHHACARWLRREQKFFWIKGKPGAGKSVLIKYLDQHVTRKLKKSNAIGLYFYFNARGDQLEKSFLGLYRSLLVQLVDAVPGLSKELDCLGKQFEVFDLQRVLASAIRACDRQIWLFIDALDECHEGDVQDLITFFGELDDVELYVCFASRHYPAVDVPTELQLVLEEVKEHSEDLAMYVKKLKLTGEELATIQQDIVKKANGIFLWVVLVVDILEKEVRKGRFHAVQQKLSEMPRGLPELFKTIIHRDGEDMDEFLLCLRWILYAMRPLALPEWYFAMMAGLGGPLEAQVTITEDRMEQFLRNSSKGLAELTKGKKVTAQFIHESVRDFLIKDHGFREICEGTGSLEGVAHDQLKICCLKGLEFEIPLYTEQGRATKKLLTPDQRQSLVTRYPFAEYASTYILHHTDRAAAECSQQQFLACSFSVSDWMRKFNAFQEQRPEAYATVPSWSYLCAERDLARLIVEPFGALTEEKQRYRTPLIASFMSSSWKVAKILLTDVGVHNPEEVLQEAKLRSGFLVNGLLSSPRRWAIGNGILLLSKHLLNTVDQGRSHDPDRDDVSLAATSGNLALLEYIMTTFPTIATKDHICRALEAPSRRGYIEAVRMLLDKVADVDSQAYDGTALYAAAQRGHVEIVKLLLDKGADVSARSRFHGTVLQTASAFGHAEIVRLLLDKGADVNSQGFDGTALYAAAHRGHVEIVKLLLDKGADVNAQGGFLGSALQDVSWIGYAGIMRLLFGEGADVNARGGYYDTALQAASRHGHAEIVRLLLNKGATGIEESAATAQSCDH